MLFHVGFIVFYYILFSLHFYSFHLGGICLESITLPDYVMIRDRDTVQSIGNLCFSLKDVVFAGRNVFEADPSIPHSNPYVDREYENNLSPRELEQSLDDWSVPVIERWHISKFVSTFLQLIYLIYYLMYVY